MLPDLPAVGIRFDLSEIKSSSYGVECWKVFWRAVDVTKLGGASLFEGDTAATLKGTENVYCIAVLSPDESVLTTVRDALGQSAEFRALAATPTFVDRNRLATEPLPIAGSVDHAGNLAGNAWNPRMALGDVLREQRQAAQVDEAPGTTVPLRPKPASSRTANLPDVSSLEGVRQLLLTSFGETKKRQFWVTPEELCDIVEHYSDLLQVQWEEASCGLSTDMTYVALFPKGKQGGGIRLIGLFPFGSESDARDYCHDKSENYSDLFGQLESLYGIQGRFALNFSSGAISSAPSHKKDREIEASELWQKIHKRREGFLREIEEDKERRQAEEKRLETERKVRQAAEAKRLEEERKVRQEAEARRRAEEISLAGIQNTRRAAGQCVLCGKSLPLLTKLFRGDRHPTCAVFQEPA